MNIPLKKNFKFLFLFFLIFSFFTFAGERPIVLVSVAPYKFFVERIAQDTLSVYLIVPAGASAHTYEPTSRQILTASQGDVWFRIGEPFEDRAIKAFRSHKPNMEVVDLRKSVDLIHCHHSHGCIGCCPGGDDLHFWLSARQMQVQIQTITDTLVRLYPQHETLYRANQKDLLIELQGLDREIEEVLKPLQNRNIAVSHPAYAYFCRDYQLQQYSVEMEGKDPTPQQMTKLLNNLRQLKIRTIYIQKQYNNKAAKLVAETIGANLVILDPYSEHYFQAMREIARAFANG